MLCGRRDETQLGDFGKVPGYGSERLSHLLLFSEMDSCDGQRGPLKPRSLHATPAIDVEHRATRYDAIAKGKSVIILRRCEGDVVQRQVVRRSCRANIEWSNLFPLASNHCMAKSTSLFNIPIKVFQLGTHGLRPHATAGLAEGKSLLDRT